MFGSNNQHQQQIDKSLEPINLRLDSHSELLDEMIRFKCECVEHRRRSDDKLMIIEANQNKICDRLKEAQIYHEKNSENLQELTDFIVTTKTTKKYMPTILTVIGAFVVVLVIVVVSVIYIQQTLQILS